MNIRQKMLLGAAALTLIPVFVTAAFMWRSSTNLAGDALDERVRAQLTSLRDTKAAQVTDEINGRLASLQQLAAQRSTLDAFKQLKSGYTTAAKDSGNADLAANTAALNEFVKTQFIPEFGKRNLTANADLSKAVASLDANAAALQMQYLVNNTNKLGEKEKLNRAPLETAYNKAHGVFHPGFERAQKLAGFYDVFLIDIETDTVVYTVFKELDFATRLAGDSVASVSGLSEAYLNVKQSNDANALFLSDFAPYLASYNDQAAFAAVPVFDGDKQVAVLAMQYPIDKITEVMSSNKAWQKIGLGVTGDVFLVGASDKLMRTNARYLLEDAAAFEKLMGDKLSATARSTMLKKNASTGLVKDDSAATQAASDGKTDLAGFTDYRGVPVVGAYAPLKLSGLNWAIVAKIDQSEAGETLSAINRSSLLTALLTGLAVVVAAGVLVTLFLRRFMRPIAKLSDTVKAVATGDTNARAKLVEQDEIGELGRSFDNLLDERNATLEKAQAENENLNNSAIGLLQTVFQLSNRDLTVRAPVTEDVIGTVSSSVNQLSQETSQTLLDIRQIADQVLQSSESVKRQALSVDVAAANGDKSLLSMTASLGQATEQLVQVAALSGESNLVAAQASAATRSAQTAVGSTVTGIAALSARMVELETSFKQLAERTKEISSAVGLVNTLTERTNLLALSAATQAAAAGDAGRGFVVVAQEVRRLSDGSAQATAQIAKLVNNIQQETKETLLTMNRLMANAADQTLAAQRAGLEMTQSQTSTAQLVDLVQRIAAFADQQTAVAAQLETDLALVRRGTTETVAASAAQAGTANALVEFSKRLTESVGQFKLSHAER